MNTDNLCRLWIAMFIMAGSCHVASAVRDTAQAVRVHAAGCR